MRLLLVGAFPYPHYQGSQVYFQEQAIALRAAGAEVELLTYASGPEAPDPRPSRPPNRALDGFRLHRSAGWTAPRSLRSGPSWAKPLGDLALAKELRHTIASSNHDAGLDAHHKDDPINGYDAILAHNAEAALVCLTAVSKPHPPIVYCVHTLMGHELSTYAKNLSLKGFLTGPTSANPPGGRDLSRRVIDRSGRVIDRWIARRVEGWMALTHASARVMHQNAKGPGALIPPPVPDPKTNFDPRDLVEVCAKHGLQADAFFLYSGNLDPYQELEILSAAAERLSALAADSDGPKCQILVASHDPAARDWAANRPGLMACTVDSAEEMQALLYAARASLVLRQAVGGFPIKLANSLAAGTPALAFHGREWGLVDGVNSLICDTRKPAESIANAIAKLSKDDDLALRLSRGARALYLEQHRPEVAAAETLALIGRIRSFRDPSVAPPRV